MPHVIYLHSALTQRRIVGATERQRRRIMRFERIDVIIAMSIAGVVNMSMLVMAAGIFHSRGLTDIAELDEVYNGLGNVVGAHTDTLFGIALLASGLSSSSIGTLAGQVVMQGFIRRQIPVFLRRIAIDGAGPDRARGRRRPFDGSRSSARSRSRSAFRSRSSRSRSSRATAG